VLLPPEEKLPNFSEQFQRSDILGNMFSGLTPLDIVTLFGALLLAMGAHEAMHAYVAHSLGDRTAYEEGRLTLNPLKHIDVVTTVLLPLVLIVMGMPPIFAAKPVPFNAHSVRFGDYGIALVAMAGPLTNFVLAALAGLSLHVFGVATGTAAYSLITLFMQVNIGLFVFNSIPFPPLDGSRVLYAFAPDWLRDIMDKIESFGIMVFLFIVLLLFQFVSPLLTTLNSAVYNFLLR
jgi:Zn-dependent protease